MTAPGIEPALAVMIDAVFDAHHEPQASTMAGPDSALWRQLDELGLIRLTGSESAGGSGAGWYEAAELLAAAVRHSVRIPLAENDLLACWLLETLGAQMDGAARTVCLLDEEGRARAVPWASRAQRIVVVWRRHGDYRAAELEPGDVRIQPGTNMIGEPRDIVVADTEAFSGFPLSPDLLGKLRMKSALVRSIQVCAAMDKALELSVDHSRSREQFGRPLSKFQAVAHLISDIAAEATLARSATEAALSAAIASEWSAPQLEFLVAAARSCAGHAASVVARNAHQVHGAIGTTAEHRLHHFTRAALAWRSEFGSVQYWDDRVTDLAMRADRLWSLISTVDEEM
ncbi:MAG: acyl-CoA dehydrogenase family protein [Mycolicibacterium sp.]|uniref:acyl-CoA dehydrogenase family protein n=1 Tax=Mycolicibacterium sp. TaxID=2320850 RepID=UPI003D0F6132